MAKSKHPYLYLHGSRWYYRRGVPAALAELDTRGIIKESTKNARLRRPQGHALLLLVGRCHPQGEGGLPDAITRDRQRRIAAATAIGLNALKPMLQFQVSLLRFWANNIEMFTSNCEKELETKLEQQGQQHAA